MKFHVTLVFLLGSAAIIGAAGLTTNDLAQAHAQGTNTLASLKRQIRPDTASGLGFVSTNEAQGVVLGDPSLFSHFKNAFLLVYFPGHFSTPLLAGEGGFFYPAV